MPVTIVSNRLDVDRFLWRLFEFYPQHPMINDDRHDPLVIDAIETQLQCLRPKEAFAIKAFYSEYRMPNEVIAQGMGLSFGYIQSMVTRSFRKLRRPKPIQYIKSALGLSFFPIDVRRPAKKIVREPLPKHPSIYQKMSHTARVSV